MLWAAPVRLGVDLGEAPPVLEKYLSARYGMLTDLTKKSDGSTNRLDASRAIPEVSHRDAKRAHLQKFVW